MVDARALAALLAQGFDDGALAVWIEPRDDDRRRRLLDALFDAFTAHVFVPRRVLDTVGEPLAAAAVWSEPGTSELTEAEREAVDAAVASVVGESGLARMGGVLGDVAARRPAEPHWYLDFLVADPARRGEGLGSAALAPGLARCDTARLPSYLWTGRESNLPFYERHGFTVSWSAPLADGLHGWGMWREPATP